MNGVTLIGLAGQAGTGKDTAALHLVQHYGFVQASFADPIRSMVLLMLEEAGVDHAYLTERSLKDQVIPGLGVSARALMQTLGTEVGRALEPDLWVRHLALRLGLHPAEAAPVHDRIVISDVRFPNEQRWVVAHGGGVIRLHRPGADPVRPHESEQHVQALKADVELHNDGPTVEGLYAKLDAVMADLRIDRREPFSTLTTPALDDARQNLAAHRGGRRVPVVARPAEQRQPAGAHPHRLPHRAPPVV